MPKHRTKQAKKKAAIQRAKSNTSVVAALPSGYAYTHTSPDASKSSDLGRASSLARKKNESEMVTQFLGYDFKLLYQDLLKTLAVAGVVMTLLLLAWKWQ